MSWTDLWRRSPPAVEQREEPQMTQHAEAAPRPTVLVVDDEAQIRDLLQMAVSAFGYDAEAAANGHEALGCLARRSYDVVICDLIMPRMNGDELFRICQQEHPEIASRFVFTSGYPEGVPLVDLTMASGQPFLPKPCRLAEIRAAIDEIAGPVAA